MNNWKIESSPIKQLIMTIAIIIAGIVLMYGFRNYDASGFTNSLAGFLLGVLLLLIGVPGLLAISKETITVFPKERKILIENNNLFRKNIRNIFFNEIESIHLSTLGNKTDGSRSYYLVLELRSGKSFPLFFPAYYTGRFNRAIAEDRRRRLENYINQ